MKILSNILSMFGYAKRSGVSNPAQWLVDWVNDGSATASGKTINQTGALRYTPFWAAVRVISGTVASLPFIVYRRTNAGKDRVKNHNVHTLLHNRPNEYMDALTFIESRQAHVLTYGNGYAEIQRDGAGRPVALWPLLPDRTFRKMSEGGIPYYEVWPTHGEKVYLPDYNVLHIKGLGFDGYTGYDVVSYHKEAIGYGVAVKEYGARFFGSDASSGGVLEHPQSLSPEAAKRLADSWNKENAGLTKAHRTKVLEEGLKYSKISVDPEQAQALEIQKYTVDDCSRIFNIPPHKLASMDSATFSNIEEQNIDFLTSTMIYWFKKWEQECNYKLFMPSERPNLFCEILVDGMLRGNIKSRYEAYNFGRNAGFLSVNDIREKENMNSIGEKGDIYIEPLNVKPAGEPAPTPPAPKPPAEPEPDGDDDVRSTHKALIKNEWSRIIKKQNNSLAHGIRDGFYDDQRDYAYKVLFDAVAAMASIFGRDKDQARYILSSAISTNINNETKLTDDDAETLTEKLFEMMGKNGDGK